MFTKLALRISGIHTIIDINTDCLPWRDVGLGVRVAFLSQRWEWSLYGLPLSYSCFGSGSIYAARGCGFHSEVAAAAAVAA
jgi:hypothetical protein